MGLPEIPNINPDDMDMDREQVINLLLASIGLEELSLARLINAEADKIQRALGTLEIPGAQGPLVHCFDDLLKLNNSVTNFLKFAMHKEFILLAKLEDVVDFAKESD